MAAESRRSTQRVLKVLLHLASTAQPATATQIGAACDIPEATLYPMLTDMESEDFVVHIPETRTWALGLSTFEIGSACLRSCPLERLGRPLLERLRRQVSGTSHLAIMQSTEVLIVVGKLTINTLNAYGAFICTLTISTSFTKRRAAGMRQRVLTILAMITLTVLIALFSSQDFLSMFKKFVLLLMVFLRWSAINLIDITALYDPKGRYGAWNVPALASFAIGILVQIPFLAQSLYTGPFTKMLGGTDISWIVGLVITAVVYYFWASRSSVAPEAMI